MEDEKINENYCIICRNNMNVNKCSDCGKYVCCSCVDLQKSISFVIRKHDNCIECKNEVFCYKPICLKCDINPYHMITDKVAVGSCSSTYDEFDIIINLNYPENNIMENQSSFQKKNDKLIIKLGLSDSVEKEREAYQYMCELIPVLAKYYKDKKILFHCFAGMSRSASFAIAYLSYCTGQTIDYSYKQVKSKRKFIKVNEGFIKSLEKFQIYYKNSI